MRRLAALFGFPLALFAALACGDDDAADSTSTGDTTCATAACGTSTSPTTSTSGTTVDPTSSSGDPSTTTSPSESSTMPADTSSTGAETCATDTCGACFECSYDTTCSDLNSQCSVDPACSIALICIRDCVEQSSDPAPCVAACECPPEGTLQALLACATGVCVPAGSCPALSC